MGLIVKLQIAEQILQSEKREAKMKANTKEIAKQRIQILFQKARTIFHDNPQLSSRYITTARKIAMAARLPLPTVYKRQICKKCNTLLVQGENCRVRIRQKREPHVVITCLNCSSKIRIPLKEKREKNKLDRDNNQNETSC